MALKVKSTNEAYPLRLGAAFERVAATGGPARLLEDTVLKDTHPYGAADDMTEDEAADGPCGNKVCVQNESRLKNHLKMHPSLSREHKALVDRLRGVKMEHAAAVEKLKATHKASLKAQKKRLAPKACKREMRSRRDLKALEVAGQLDTQKLVRDLKKDNHKFRYQNDVLLDAVTKFVTADSSSSDSDSAGDEIEI
ncbi:hypothetical protein T484DRAFT_1849142 [Baffinella frigidus]|nr:hypothetical protein T484DRAFT_1849142 [Cryptophyta sp. CCMP2293]